jgi:hypothetical protein
VQTLTRQSPPRPILDRAGGDSRFPAPSPLERGLAALVPVSLAVGYTVSYGVQVGHLVAFLLLPVWLSSVARFRGATIFLVLCVVAPVSGVVLTLLARSDHTINNAALVTNSVEIVGLGLGVGALLWSRRVLGGPWVAVLFGVGMTMGIPLGDGLGSDNPWRFAFSIPLTVLLLAIAWLLRSRVFAVIAALGLCLVSALNDSRAGSAMLAMTAMLVLWQMRPTASGARGSTIRTLLSIGALGSIVYTVTQAVILGGLLGERTQERTEAQIETSGNLLLGGRPEAGATFGLLTDRPWGYGSGITPNLDDILVAKTGMDAIGYAPNNGYVEGYMFGSSYEVHSIVGDLWILFGFAGAILAIVLLVVTFQSLSHHLARRTASALLIWLAVRMLWNLLFSPMHSSIPLLMLFLAIGLVVRRTDDPDVPVGKHIGTIALPIRSPR